MQELLGRIARLDPSASLGLRVIACFDELMVGNVNTRALLAAAASLAGCVAGFHSETPAKTVRIDPRGHHAADVRPEVDPAFQQDASDGLTVWLERNGERQPNDAIVLERLALAVRMRHGRGRESDHRRDLSLLLDPEVDVQARCVSAITLGLRPGTRYRVVCAPLFAVWPEHPQGPEDVVATRFGAIHALVLPASAHEVAAVPSGVGVATEVEDLHHSFRTALVALRLCDPPAVGSVLADDFGGLIGLLADAPDGSFQPDVALVDAVMAYAWGAETLSSVVRSHSLRQAAREAGVHHSTMQSRLETVIATLGFDPFEGYGRTRLGTAYLVWRLRHSRVLDLPAPIATPRGS